MDEALCRIQQRNGCEPTGERCGGGKIGCACVGQWRLQAENRRREAAAERDASEETRP